MIVCFFSASSSASAACNSCRRPAEKCSCRARNAYSLARAATQTKGHCLRRNLPRVFTERHRSRASRACRIYLLASDDFLVIVDRVHLGLAELCSAFERVFRWPPYQKLGQRVARIFRILLSGCLLYTSPSPRDMRRSRMPSSA